MKTFKTYGIFLSVMAVIPSSVFAHALWTPGSSTPPRDITSSKLKVAPCGGTQGNPAVLLPRGTKPKIFKPGETINVKWVETVDHEGNFHINLLDGNNKIIKHIVKDYSDSTAPAGTGIQERKLDITIPTTDNQGKPIPVPCTDCSLQLLQEMWPGNPPTRAATYDPVNYLPAGTFYFSCSDIKIESTSNIVPGDVSFPVFQARINNIDNVLLKWVNPAELANNNNNVAYRVLIVMDTSAINSVPTDGTEYTVGQTFGSGSAKVVYNGNLEAAAIMGLTDTANLYFKFFTFNVSNYYSTGIEGALVMAAPVAPIVALSTKQGTQINVTKFDRTNGMITVTANITNAITGDTFEYDWSRTDNRLTNQSSNKTDKIFKFDPALLGTGDYNITVAATNTVANSGLTSSDKVVSIKIVSGDAIKTTTSTTSSSGGCSLSTNAKFDPLLLLLSLLSIVVIGFKFIRIK